jgi:hypothetical protein
MIGVIHDAFESVSDLALILRRFPGPVLKVLWVLSILATAFITRLVVRRQQSRDMVLTLRRELYSERQRHAKAETATAKKVAVYREAAVGVVVRDLLERAGE